MLLNSFNSLHQAWPTFIIIIYFKTVHFFHAQLELDIFPWYEASPHIPEHCPFRVQTKLICVTFLSKSSCPCPHISPLPPTHFYRPTSNHLHSYVPHAKTISIYHALPLQPHSEHPKDCTRPHFSSYPSETHQSHHHHTLCSLQAMQIFSHNKIN